jgi:broad specificity phosphatase PhoE
MPPSIILVRHGHSVANERGIIISDVEEGKKEEWGLTAMGREQAASVVESLVRRGELPTPPTRARFAVYSSPFSRARETAESIRSSLESAYGSACEVTLADDLRERYFGRSLEGTSSDGYERVWNIDRYQSLYKAPGGGGESVMDVASRCEAFVERIVHEHTREDHTVDAVFLVSHGDTLSILATHIGKRGRLQDHRELGALGNCETTCISL